MWGFGLAALMAVNAQAQGWVWGFGLAALVAGSAEAWGWVWGFGLAALVAIHAEACGSVWIWPGRAHGGLCGGLGIGVGLGLVVICPHALLSSLSALVGCLG